MTFFEVNQITFTILQRLSYQKDKRPDMRFPSQYAKLALADSTLLRQIPNSRFRYVP